MKKFNKIVAIEPIKLVDSARDHIRGLASEVVFHTDIPQSDEEIARRVGDADAVLLTFTSRLEREAMELCPNLKYVGMCCSLYSPESANVDIRYAQERGITVTGIRDYGDEGVVEYVVSELVRIMHGFGEEAWEGDPREITGLNVGVVGLGKSGGMIADAMSFFGAKVSYFARSEKEWAKAKGYEFKPLRELLAGSDVVFCCLNKNTVLLHKEEFEALGSGKILFNTGLSPAWDEEAMLEWLESGKNRLLGDTLGAVGGEHLLSNPKIRCAGVSTGMTRQAYHRLSSKVINNMENFLNQ